MAQPTNALSFGKRALQTQSDLWRARLRLRGATVGTWLWQQQGKGLWCGQEGSAARVPAAPTGTPHSWHPPRWQLVALEPPAGMEGVWSSSASISASSSPGAAGDQSHLCLLAPVLCFYGKAASRQLLREAGAPGCLLQSTGLLARAAPSQSSISSFGKCFESLCKVSWRRAKCDYITCLDSEFLGAGSRRLFYLLSCVSTVWPR